MQDALTSHKRAGLESELGTRTGGRSGLSPTHFSNASAGLNVVLGTVNTPVITAFSDAVVAAILNRRTARLTESTPG